MTPLPLPAGMEPAHEFVSEDNTDLLHRPGMMRPNGFKPNGLFTKQQLLDYRKAVIEECATECERMMMYPNAKQESAAHQNVWAAARAIRSLKNG